MVKYFYFIPLIWMASPLALSAMTASGSLFSKKIMNPGFKTEVSEHIIIQNTSIEVLGDQVPYSSMVKLKLDFDRPKIYHPKLIEDVDQIPALYDIRNYTLLKGEPILYEYRDIFFFSSNAIVLENGSIYKIQKGCNLDFGNDGSVKYPPPRIDSVLKTFDSVVCLGHSYTQWFGHWFMEILPQYSLIPQEILQRSVIAVPNKKSFHIEELSYLGIKESQIIDGHTDLYFAKHYYTMRIETCGDGVHEFMLHFRKRMVEKFGLDKSPPTRYVIFNRWGFKERNLPNFNEMFFALQKQWPTIPWENGSLPTNFYECAKYFNSMKLFFGVHGSLAANCVFMQPGSIFIELSMHNPWPLFCHYTQTYGLRTTIGKDAQIPCYEPNKKNVSIPYIIRLFEAALNDTEV